MEQNDRQKERILIIGAGAAGLQSAYTLVTQYGYTDVAILEARDRIGGRIHTWQAPANFPALVDLGAAWVHGTDPFPMANPMLHYINGQDLVEIMPGCGWLRPGTVLHRGLRGGDGQGEWVGMLSPRTLSQLNRI